MSIYTPGSVPSDPSQMASFLVNEFYRISRTFAGPVESVKFVPLSVEPEKLFDGLEVLADGTNWNPGSGAGRYYYFNNAWRFLG